MCPLHVGQWPCGCPCGGFPLGSHPHSYARVQVKIRMDVPAHFLIVNAEVIPAKVSFLWRSLWSFPYARDRARIRGKGGGSSKGRGRSPGGQRDGVGVKTYPISVLLVCQCRFLSRSSWPPFRDPHGRPLEVLMEVMEALAEVLMAWLVVLKDAGPRL